MPENRCRFCDELLNQVFVDLGLSPLANAYRRAEELDRDELRYPLQAYVCGQCLLVQLPTHESPEKIFSDYAYFSSYSNAWLDHCRDFAQEVTRRFALQPSSRIVELASNDGYLLQYFQQRGFDVLGIEPAANVARVAIENGIPTEIVFFGVQAARELVDRGHKADLLVGNNVLAHVPDLNDFVAGMKILLADDGVISMEFPHLLRLIEQSQFDTIYQEHYSYFSFLVANKVFAAHGLRVFDVEQFSTHGGSIRVYACHEQAARVTDARVAEMQRIEADAGLAAIETYQGFDRKAEAVKSELLAFLSAARLAGKRVAGYGAPAKSTTLLNYCGVDVDLLEFTVDRSPYKQGQFLPGTRIPIHGPERIMEWRPDYVLILPWNIKDEIMSQMSGIAEWGGKFVIPSPRLEVCG